VRVLLIGEIDWVLWRYPFMELVASVLSLRGFLMFTSKKGDIKKFMGSWVMVMGELFFLE
jgi:hypothetical protein